MRVDSDGLVAVDGVHASQGTERQRGVGLHGRIDAAHPRPADWPRRGDARPGDNDRRRPAAPRGRFLRARLADVKSRRPRPRCRRALGRPSRRASRARCHRRRCTASCASSVSSLSHGPAGGQAATSVDSPSRPDTATRHICIGKPRAWRVARRAPSSRNRSSDAAADTTTPPRTRRCFATFRSAAWLPDHTNAGVGCRKGDPQRTQGLATVDRRVRECESARRRSGASTRGRTTRRTQTASVRR